MAKCVTATSRKAPTVSPSRGNEASGISFCTNSTIAISRSSLSLNIDFLDLRPPHVFVHIRLMFRQLSHLVKSSQMSIEGLKTLARSLSPGLGKHERIHGVMSRFPFADKLGVHLEPVIHGSSHEFELEQGKHDVGGDFPQRGSRKTAENLR